MKNCGRTESDRAHSLSAEDAHEFGDQVAPIGREHLQPALEALWGLNLCGGFDEAEATAALDHADPFVRLWAVRLLGAADIVFYDALVPGEILLFAQRAIKIAVGKRSGRRSTAQRFINKRLADAARTQRVVVRLKGGDPLLFGRAQEEITYLRTQGVRVEVVPGITAALAASASLGTSLTERGVARSVAFVTPRVGRGEPPSRWLSAAMAADTVAIYMGAHDAPAIVAALAGAGKPIDTPVVVLEGVSLQGERIAFGTLGELHELVPGGGGPVVIVLGEVYREHVAARQPVQRRCAARARAAAAIRRAPVGCRATQRPGRRSTLARARAP